MHWEDERYIKLYTRDTPEWALLSWQARSVFLLVLRIVDRAGVLPLGRAGLRGLSAMLRIPEDVLSAAVEELQEDGCLRVETDRLVVPNFIEAQEAKASDKERQAARRERARSKATSGAQVASRGVTQRHAESHDVTRGHAASHGVTTRQDETRQDERRQDTHSACAGVRDDLPASPATVTDERPSSVPPPSATPVVAKPAPAPATKPSENAPSAPPDQPNATMARTGPQVANGPGAPRARSGVTSDLLRELWEETRKRPGVALAAWSSGMSIGRLSLLDGLAGTRPLEGPEGWRAVMDALAVSDHCNGRTTGWKASPDWLLKPDVVVDLLAGKYANGAGPKPRGPWTPPSTSNRGPGGVRDDF